MDDTPMTYAERAAMEIEADRLFGLYLRVRMIRQKEQISIETAIHRAHERGMFNAEDYEMRLAVSRED